MRYWIDILHALARFKALSLAAALLLALNLLIYLGGLLPVQAAARGLERELITTRDLRVQEQSRKQALVDLARFRQLLPDRPGLIRLMSDLSRSAKQSGISVPTLAYGADQQAGPGLSKSKISLSLIGGYPNIKQWIAGLEARDQLLIPDEITLAVSRGGENVLGHLSIEVYLHDDRPL